jgi:hypothetical protein
MALLTAALLMVTIRTYDAYGVPAPDLQRAIMVASATLSAAGIATDWIDCRREAASDRCRAATNRAEIIVRIGRAPGGPDRGEVLGSAAVDTLARAGSLATLYADRIAAHAAAAGTDPGTLLGRAAAHEIGHLLMGTTGHARRGVMRARWSQADLQQRLAREWRFSAQEAQQMRDGVVRATAASDALEPLVASAALTRPDGR